MKFSDNLRNALADRKMTQKELGSHLGTSQQTVSRWIKKENEPDFKTLLEICMFLDETPNDLLGYNDIPEEYIKTRKFPENHNKN